MNDNATVAPDGTNTALMETQNTGGDNLIYSNGVAGTTALYYTASVYFKRGTKPTCGLYVDDAGFGGVRWLSVYTWATGVLTNTLGGLNGGAGGVAPTSTVEILANGWIRLALTYRTVSTGSMIVMVNRDMASVGGTTYIWGAQLETGSFATPYIPTTSAIASRTNTQAIVDLTGNNTLTASSLTYAADNTFSFNGNASSNYIDCGNATGLQITGAITIDAWVKPTAYTNLGNIVAKNGNSAYRFRLDSTAGGLWWYVSGNAIQGGSAPLNTWSYLTVSGDSSGLYAYINGVLVASNAVAYAPSAVTGGNLIIGALSAGSETFIGTIAAVKMYNRALSADEVKQNFNALRGRYGI